MRACPADAIHGESKSPHFIDQNACIHCGSCLAACAPANAAIYRTSGERRRVEPRTERKDPGAPAQPGKG